ncbi:MAG: hypothetical protein IJ991_14080 [Thermoguttaceae bacterium]|nr:hypothetical protein [Thermoguttaceae bacterium]
MKRHFSLLATTVATLFAVGGNLFAKDEPETDQFAKPVLSKDADFEERQLAFALTTFHRALENESTQANTLVAPFGVYRVLGALSLGSAGQTKTEIDAALFRDDLDADAWKKDVADAAAALSQAPEVKLAGGLWAAPHVKLAKEFQADLRDLTGQNASTFDFSQADACAKINSWFSRNTSGRVSNLLDSVHAKTSLLIADATTFDGKWKNAFDPKETSKRPFVGLDGSETEFPLMSKTADFKYCQAKDFQYLEAPYADDRFSLVVVLPNDYESYAKIERSLTPAQLLDCRQKAKSVLVDFSFPKFTIERSVNLVKTLRSSGVVDAFGLDADFSRFAGDVNLTVDQAKQGSFFAVDEAGTTAAAATAVTAVPKAAPTQFSADRPFFYLIRHNKTGIVLFAGRFVKPVEDGGLAAPSDQETVEEGDKETDEETVEEGDKETDEETAEEGDKETDEETVEEGDKETVEEGDKETDEEGDKETDEEDAEETDEEKTEKRDSKKKPRSNSEKKSSDAGGTVR